MGDPMIVLGLACAAIAGLGIAAAAALKGWQDWLEIRQLELEQHQPGPSPSPAARIELADLRERVRKLEAIAAGVDY